MMGLLWLHCTSMFYNLKNKSNVEPRVGLPLSRRRRWRQTSQRLSNVCMFTCVWDCICCVAPSYLSQIKWVERERFSLLKGHDLDVEGPGWEAAIGDGIEQVSNGIIWVGGGQAVCLLHRQILDALISLRETVTRNLGDKAKIPHEVDLER